MPVVEPGAFQLLVVRGEAHRTYQVEPCSGDGAGAGDIAGVLGYLRFYQYDVEFQVERFLSREKLLPKTVHCIL